MDYISNIAKAIVMLLEWQVFVWMLVGMIAGVVLGALPGLTGILAITVMLGPSYYLDPLHALIFMTSVYVGSVYGGGITSILINIPGAPSNISTAFDGFPMAQQGKHNEAIGISVMASAIGTGVGALLLLILLVPLGVLVMKLAAPEKALIVIIALLSVGLSKEKSMQIIITALFGILVGTIGTSPYGLQRGIFGQYALMEGIPMTSTLLGMLCISELYILAEKKFVVDKTKKTKQNAKSIFKGMGMYFEHKMMGFISTIFGFIIGLLPAAGAAVAGVMSYNLAKRFSKKGENYGKGEPEGIAVTETANNATIPGAMGTMMLLGIPGSSTTAILIAAFMVHGMMPGPYLIKENFVFAHALVLGMLFEVVMMVLVTVVFVLFFSKLIYLPVKTLIPSIFVFAFVGALAERALLIDLVIMVIFSIFGYIMKKAHIPVVGFILGFVLGGSLEEEIIRTYIVYAEKPLMLFNRHVFTIMVILILISTVLVILFNRRKRKAGMEEEPMILS